MKLSDEEIAFISAEIDKSNISMQELKDDLLDHFCCFIEHEKKKGLSFAEAYNKATVQICPDGFAQLEKETLFLLNAKRIILMKKLMYFIGLISSMSISIGWLFKLLHWPGGGELFTYGFLGFVLLFLPLLAIDRYKLNLQAALSEKLRLVLGFGSAIVTGMAVLFKMMHLQGADILLIGGALIFAFGFLPFLFFRMYRKALE
ncbi:hypothetical protein [Adhaeribacter rhizoryzae]|uniref:Uncharacterized protein n=1 Tax=Adhaeribacter rhizoryzae TaxID=2607907 RepID=A0A5M6DH49_9BACT|nr:hypothetical protein [Adhaeribacter rhizoryzae]KAA5545716.1 hypothetical protein F0145_12340 [Adhaeribacter rhizoryzae]